jgi:Fe-S oxidoreductase
MTMEIVAPYQDGIDVIRQNGGDVFRFCYQCGMCDTVCPWNKVTNFSMRKLVREATFGLPELDGEAMWRCTTCGKCPQRCPRGVGTMDVSVSFRRIASEADIIPAPVHTVTTSLASQGNPLREERSTRGDWAKDLSVKTFTDGMEILYFPGCYYSYDRRMRKATEATVKILNAAGVDFGILGSKETCCGESIRKTGAEDLFKQLARENIKNFIDAGVKKILVSSPHCYHTFKNEYIDFKVDFEIVHITQFLYELINDGRLKLNNKIKQKVTYHDPCYLGRHNNIYDEPREVLNAISGLKLVEMSETRKDSLCCGGGGGRIWMETPKGERFSDIRMEQASAVKAEVLVTSCPYCITNFEDSRLNMPESEAIEVKDLTEIIAEAL